MGIVLIENWNAWESLAVTEGYLTDYATYAEENFYGSGAPLTTANGGLTDWLATSIGVGNDENVLFTPCMYQEYTLYHASTTPSPQTPYINTCGTYAIDLPTAQPLGSDASDDNYYYYCFWIRLDTYTVPDDDMKFGFFSLNDGTNCCFMLCANRQGHLYAYPTNNTLANVHKNPATDIGDNWVMFGDEATLGEAYADTENLSIGPLNIDGEGGTSGNGDWKLVEVKFRLQDAAATVDGHFEVRVDGRSVMTYTGDTNRSDTVSSITTMWFSHLAFIADQDAAVIAGHNGVDSVGYVQRAFYDDILVLDESGSKLNGFPDKYTLYSMKPNQASPAGSPTGDEGWEASIGGTNAIDSLEEFDLPRWTTEEPEAGTYTAPLVAPLDSALTGLVESVVWVDSVSVSLGEAYDRVERRVGTTAATTSDLNQDTHPLATTTADIRKFCVMEQNPITAADWTLSNLTSNLYMRWNFQNT